MQRVEETPGALLASGVGRHANRRVYLKEFAVVGARSSDLKAQVDRALPIEPEVAVILIGGNDVTHTVLPAHSVRHLSEAVRRLTAAGAKVVVGTCPDLGTIQPIAPPLRQVARLWSRRLAAAQTIATVETGGRSVSLGDVLGPEFAAAPAVLFGPDQFHPSAEGYRALANVLLPSVLAALDEAPAEEITLEAYRGEGVLPISRAAIRAVKQPGTELDGTEVAGKRAGVRGLWVELRHRRRRPQTTAEAPDEHETAAKRPGRTSSPRSSKRGSRPTPAGGPAPSSRRRRFLASSSWIPTPSTQPPPWPSSGSDTSTATGPTAVRALDHVDLAFAPGTFTAVMGPSGSGKSTFLTCAGALERPTTGTVLVAGQDVTALGEDDRTRLRRERIGFVFQSFHLLPYLTAAQNVSLPLRLAGRWGGRQDRTRIRRCSTRSASTAATTGCRPSSPAASSSGSRSPGRWSPPLPSSWPTSRPVRSTPAPRPTCSPCSGPASTSSARPS